MVLMHHLVTGRQFSVYDLNRNNQCLYTINMEDPELKFKKQPNWLDIGISNNFIYIGDHDKFILWNARNGQLIRSVEIPSHYDHEEDPVKDPYSYKGHTYHFDENSFLILHSMVEMNLRNTPLL